MKIEFTQYRTLDELARTVKPGDTVQSPDVPDDLMHAYVQNGIARDVTPGATATAAPPPKAMVENQTQEEAINVG